MGNHGEGRVIAFLPDVSPARMADHVHRKDLVKVSLLQYHLVFHDLLLQPKGIAYTYGRYKVPEAVSL